MYIPIPHASPNPGSRNKRHGLKPGLALSANAAKTNVVRGGRWGREGVGEGGREGRAVNHSPLFFPFAIFFTSGVVMDSYIVAKGLVLLG